MARPKSNDKRTAILDAAVRVFAERGLAAATSAISSAAGIAEGTLFTYFKTKDELVNAVYRQLKAELAIAMMSRFPAKKSVRLRLLHIWTRYVGWGVENPLQQKVLRQVEMWHGLTKESKKAGSAPFREIETMMREAVRDRMVKNLPQVFMQATMSALAETVMELSRHDRKRARVYENARFEMLWAGIAKK